ncbi:putative Arf-GAP with SH3 domain ANK repeat and PH domain-containing protein [Naja naja]|nr:putative Arf-GAP with SH3 domain ANK repeat and PH domain-containing protein [Naja naja]
MIMGSLKADDNENVNPCMRKFTMLHFFKKNSFYDYKGFSIKSEQSRAFPYSTKCLCQEENMLLTNTKGDISELRVISAFPGQSGETKSTRSRRIRPSPIKKERSPRPQSFCHSSSISPQDKMAVPGLGTPRDKQRLSYGAFPHQIFVSASIDSATSPTTVDGPPLPPRNAGKGPTCPPSTLPLSTPASSGSSTLSKKKPPPPPPGHKRTLSDPPSPQPHGPQNKGQITGTAKTALGPRVLPKLPQKVALRKIETIHLPSVDKSSHHSEIFQKSASLCIDLPLKPQPADLAPKPGELPPKPQLGDLPPKPQLADLPPKPQMKDLPPKPQLGETLAKSPGGELSLDLSLPRPVRNHPIQSKEIIQKQASEDSGDTTPGSAETPVPLPRKINMGKNKVKRVKTIYDCQADNDDELTFVEGEIIIVTGEEDQEWWIGHIEGKPERKGVFPVSFVHILSD